MADPGLAQHMSERVADELARELSEELGGECRVEPDQKRLPLDSNGDVPLFQQAEELRESEGWDWLVYYTELPRFYRGQPMIAQANAEQKAIMVSVPNAWGVGMASRLRRLTVALIALTRITPDDKGAAEGARARVKRLLVGARRTERDPEDQATEYTVRTGVLGRTAVVFGTVRSNRPLRFVGALSNSLALATAAGAFGIFYGSIWAMSDALSATRLTGISVAAVAVMAIWLIMRNGLWDSRGSLAGRQEAFLSNCATAITIGAGTVAMYVAVLAIMMVLAVAVINADYLAAELEHPVGPGDYAMIAWLSASLGTFAGALGSNFNSEDAIQEATYSRRVFERRRLAEAESAA